MIDLNLLEFEQAQQTIEELKKGDFPVDLVNHINETNGSHQIYIQMLWGELESLSSLSECCEMEESETFEIENAKTKIRQSRKLFTELQGIILNFSLEEPNRIKESLDFEYLELMNSYNDGLRELEKEFRQKNEQKIKQKIEKIDNEIEILHLKSKEIGISSTTAWRRKNQLNLKQIEKENFYEQIKLDKLEMILEYNRKIEEKLQNILYNIVILDRNSFWKQFFEYYPLISIFMENFLEKTGKELKHFFLE